MPDILSLRGEPGWIDDTRPRIHDDDAGVPPSDVDVIPTLAQWVARAAAGTVQPAVWLAPGDDVAALLPSLGALQLIALAFPKAADGRAYSTATLLRTRHGYRGELRAVGDVAIDQLHALRRVGFDSAELPAQRVTASTLATVRTVLATFGDGYQTAVDQPLPLFRRRLPGTEAR